MVMIDGKPAAFWVQKAKAHGLVADPKPIVKGRSAQEIWLSMMDRKFYRALWTQRQRMTRPWIRAQQRQCHAQN